MTPQKLAPYVLKALASHQVHGELCSLQMLVEELRVRRADVRRTVSVLHEQGYLDALRMRLTMEGFAIGEALRKARLPELRAARRTDYAAA